MQFCHTTTIHSLYKTFTRHLSSSSPDLPNLRKIPSKYRPQAIKEAQRLLTDYLHTTRTLPFTFAEHISKNSLFSLSDVMAKVEFSPQSFSKSFQRFLRYDDKIFGTIRVTTMTCYHLLTLFHVITCSHCFMISH